MNEDIHLSVVATTRNDNHGGSLTARMQHFVDGFVAQCKRHDLRAELILVEWNPPADRVPLAEELRWPADSSPCDVRIVTVPREVHARYAHADKIPLFQMIAKNVGIRRARGKYVLATNVDILFSDGSMRFMRDRLRPGCLYRADRVDIPPNVPADADYARVLAFCEERGFRVHAPAFTVVRAGERWTLRERALAHLSGRLGYLVLCLRFVAAVPRILRTSVTNRGRATEVLERYLPPRQAQEGGAAAPASQPGFLGLLSRVVLRRLPGVIATFFRTWPFTNACGDFTLLSRDDWFRLRGYPEWHVFSWHLDSLLVYHALGSRMGQQRLGLDAAVYHIEHGKGYTPEGAAELFSRLTEKAIPFLTDRELEGYKADIAASRRSAQTVQFNGPSWGLVDVALPDAAPGAAAARRQSTASATYKTG